MVGFDGRRCDTVQGAEEDDLLDHQRHLLQEIEDIDRDFGLLRQVLRLMQCRRNRRRESVEDRYRGGGPILSFVRGFTMCRRYVCWISRMVISN